MVYNKHVAAGLGNLFGKTEHSNCVVVFTVRQVSADNVVSSAHAPAEGGEPAHDNGAKPAGDAPTQAIPYSQTESLQCGIAVNSFLAFLEDEPLPTRSFEEARWLAVAGADADASAPAASAGAGSRHGEIQAFEVRSLGEPLPAHTFVLCLASERFQTQVERWAGEPAAVGPGSREFAAATAGGGGGAATAAADEEANEPAGPCTPSNQEEGHQHRQLQRQPQRPPLELRMALGGEEELPAALAAIKFAYTGHIEAGSVEEALQVWRQADYMQMKGCVEACVGALRGKLGAAATRSSTNGSGHGSGNAATPPPVLELYSCTQLWPDPEQEPAFAALLTKAKPQLVAHFGDALAVLNREELYDQMRVLPAVGLEALLESDDFGTDSESSVVLVLAEWMAANYGSTDAATRRRLCGLLRLAQCSRAYLDWVLPALALDHHDHPDSEVGWLPLTPEQASCLSYYGRATEKEIQSFLEGPEEMGCPAAWFSARPRRCVPPQAHTYTFSISREELCREFGSLEAGQEKTVCPYIQDTLDGDLRAMGLEWYPSLTYQQGASSASLQVTGRLPQVYAVEDAGLRSSVISLASLRRPLAMLRSCWYLQVPSALGQSVNALLLQLSPDSLGWFNQGFDAKGCIKLFGAPAPPAPQQPQQPQQQAQPPTGWGQELQERLEQQLAQCVRQTAVVGQWSRYLTRDGVLKGKVVILR